MNQIAKYLSDYREQSNDFCINLLKKHTLTCDKNFLIVPGDKQDLPHGIERWIEDFHDNYELIVIAATAESLCKFSVALFKKLHAIEQLRNKLCYVTGAIPCEYNVKQIHHHLGDKSIDIFFVNGWPYGAVWENPAEKAVNANMDPVSKPNLYTCFNVHAKPHRYGIVSELVRSGLYHKGYTSLLTPANQIQAHHHRDLQHIFPNLFDEWSKLWEQKSDIMPLKLNYTGIALGTISPEDLNMYNTSYLSIITETMYLNQENSSAAFQRGQHHEPSLHTQFLTEKTYRTIRACHPFILVTTPDNLQCLRDAGYRTFDPWIDESYDQIHDDQERLIAIVDELKRLNQQTPKEWLEWQQAVRPILEHNLNLLLQTQPECLHHSEITI